MARKKKVSIVEQIEDLLEFAQTKNLPDGFFAGDIEDEMIDRAKEQAKQLADGPLIDQLEFLVESGFEIGRLREIIEENQH